MADIQRLVRRRRTKSGEEAPPPSDNNKKKSPKKGRYNLRSGSNKKKVGEDSVRWVDDDTLFDEDDDEDDSSFDGEEEEDDDDEEKKKQQIVKSEGTRQVHGITVPNSMPVSVKIHLHARMDEDDDEDEGEYEEYDEFDEEDEEDEDDDDDEDEEEDDQIPESFIRSMLARELGRNARTGGGRGAERTPTLFIIGDDHEKRGKNSKKESADEPPLKLSRRERDFFETLPKTIRKATVKKMELVSKMVEESDTPYKFRILDMNTSAKIQSEIIRKVDAMTRMGSDSGEAQKLRNWVDGILRVPFGKTINLPVTMKDGPEKCSQFLKEATEKMDKSTYGMAPAKTQIMQVIAQWISNPASVGNVIAMQGAPGVGKTAFARNGIAGVLQRPFMFFSLGGASDVAHYVGHSYTYEGSMWGRIIDAIIQSGCMNPVLYFDELDKVSGTPHGEEIISMLIHLTDRSQNSQYHDRYFAGIDFDLSQCLFVFSFNDESKVHPVLKDRMRVINLAGYKDHEKKVIIANYVWPEVLKHAGIPVGQLSAEEDAANYIIKEFSAGEEGMRNLIRIVEGIVARVNLLRISDETTAKAYKFWIPTAFPLKLTRKMIETLLCDFNAASPEHWRSLYM